MRRRTCSCLPTSGEAIENAAGSHYAQDDWDGGAVAMGQQLATYIGSGDGSSTMMRVAGAVLAFMVGSGWLAFYMWRGVTGRRLGRAAHKKMMQVVYDYDLTELKAETLPAQSSQSRDIGSDYRRFLAEYDVVSRAWKDFGERAVLNGSVAVFVLRPLVSPRGQPVWSSSTPL